MRELLEQIANDDSLEVSTKSIEQKQRNTIKRELTEALGRLLTETIGDSSIIQLYRTEKGIMLSLDNEKVGMIPVEFQVAIKNLDCDPVEEEEAFKLKLKEQQEKKARADQLKAQKIARQQEIKAQKQKLRDLQSIED